MKGVRACVVLKAVADLRAASVVLLEKADALKVHRLLRKVDLKVDAGLTALLRARVVLAALVDPGVRWPVAWERFSS